MGVVRLFYKVGIFLTKVHTLTATQSTMTTQEVCIKEAPLLIRFKPYSLENVKIKTQPHI